jgi:type IV pilus assembly protein PilC
VREGRSIHGTLHGRSYLPSTVVAAIAVGEDSGRLGDAMEFVSTWLEEQNELAIASLTRLIEPVILLVMGVMVGGVCIALFLPLFDIATAA